MLPVRCMKAWRQGLMAGGTGSDALGASLRGMICARVSDEKRIA